MRRSCYGLFAALSAAILSLAPANCLAGETGLDFANLKQAARRVPNLGVVSRVLVRGAQPEPGGLGLLKASGVRTVVNLRNVDETVEEESRLARALGLKFVHIPMSVFESPSRSQVRRFLVLVDDPANQPVFVHCRQGQDRTGLMVGAWRIEKEGWSAGKAYAEMLHYGFHPFFLNISAALYDHAARLGRPEPMPHPSHIVDDIKRRIDVITGAL